MKTVFGEIWEQFSVGKCLSSKLALALNKDPNDKNSVFVIVLY